MPLSEFVTCKKNYTASLPHECIRQFILIYMQGTLFLVVFNPKATVIYMGLVALHNIFDQLRNMDLNTKNLTVTIFLGIVPAAYS